MLDMYPFERSKFELDSMFVINLAFLAEKYKQYVFKGKLLRTRVGY